jgi:hypothetical protein
LRNDKRPNNQHLVGFLAEADEFSADKMERFWLNLQNIQQSSITESELFSGKMMGPASEDIIISNLMLDLLVEYYMAIYETLEFRKSFREGHEDLKVISVKINQFGRCRIGSEIFGSNMTARYIKSSYIVAKFIIQDNNVDCYLGQIQFFFLTRLIYRMEN